MIDYADRRHSESLGNSEHDWGVLSDYPLLYACQGHDLRAPEQQIDQQGDVLGSDESTVLNHCSCACRQSRKLTNGVIPAAFQSCNPR